MAGIREQRAWRSTTASPHPASFLRGDRGLYVASMAFCGYALLFALVRQNRSAAADLAITLRLQRRRAPWLSRLMAAVSWPGFSPQSLVLPLGLGIGFWSFGRPIEAVFQSLAWGTTFLSTISKARMRRPRPISPLVRVVQARLGGSSFPSGHVLSYVGVYGFLAYSLGLIMRPVWLRRLIVAVLCGLLALVGPSRIYQGHHWPTDVLASYLLGLSYLIGLTALYRRALARWERSR